MLKIQSILEAIDEMSPEEFVEFWDVRPSFLSYVLGCSEEIAKRYCLRKEAKSKCEAPTTVKRAIAMFHQRLIAEGVQKTDLSFFARQG